MGIVTYSAGFRPSEVASAELFKRAKAIVVTSGSVPSLLLAMYSTPGVPVFELASVERPPTPYETFVGSGVGVVESGVWVEAAAKGLRLKHQAVRAVERVAEASLNDWGAGFGRVGFGGFGYGVSDKSGGGSKQTYYRFDATAVARAV